MRKTLSIFYFSFILTNATAQLDSLKNAAVMAKHDSTRLKVYAQIIRTTLFANPNVAQQYAIKYDSLAVVSKREEDIAFGKNFLGMASYVKNDYVTAINYYLDAIKRFEKLKNPLRVGIALNNIAACYQHRKIPQQTIDYYKKALNIFTKLNETTWIGNVSHNIANEYHKLADKTNDSKLKNNYLEEGFKNEKIALASFEKNKDDYSIGLSHITFGNLYFVKQDFTQALQNYNRAKSLINEADDPESVGMVYENIGNTLYETQKYDASIENLKKAIVIYDKINALAPKKNAVDVLLRVYYAKKDYKNAFDYQRTFIELSDSLFSQEKDAAMLDALKKYESEKKEQENKLLNQQLDQQKQRQLAYIIGLVGLLIFSVVVAYFWYKNKQKNQLIEKQNQKLSDLNQEKNHLISMVSHDLSTPFLTIKTWNSVLQLNLKDNPKALDASKIIQQSADSGISLIKKILDVEKAETNQHQLNLETFDLPNLIKRISDDFTIVAQQKNIEIKVSSNPNTFSILSDKHLMGRVIENLLSNAIKYSNPDSRVWINTENFPDKTIIKVKDKGIGIAANEVQNLFSKYGTTASKPTANESSTGLGLSIVKRILDEIGGEISCESQLNEGSEFTVVLKK